MTTHCLKTNQSVIMNTITTNKEMVHFDILLSKQIPIFEEFISDSNKELYLKFGFDPYRACTPSTSSILRSTFLVLGLKLGYITASLTDECANPSTCPISCVATDSKSTATFDLSFSKSTAHVSASSKWNLPFSGRTHELIPLKPRQTAPRRRDRAGTTRF